MKLLFFVSFFILFSCGKDNGKGTVFTSSNYQVKEGHSLEKVDNKFFQVSLDSFRFQSTEMEESKELEFKKSSKFKYYEMIGTRDFLERQLSYFPSHANIFRSSHVELFHLEEEKKHRTFKYLLDEALEEKENHSSLNISINGSIEIDPLELEKSKGIGVYIWDQYHDNFFELKVLLKNELTFSEFYQHQLKFNFSNMISKKWLRLLMQKELKLAFKLEQKDPSIGITFFNGVGKSSVIQKFKNINNLKRYLSKDKKRLVQTDQGNYIHNLDLIGEHINFYYLIKRNREEINKDFPFYRKETHEIKMTTDLIVPKRKLKGEFIGDILLETLNVDKYKRTVQVGLPPGNLLGSRMCSLWFEKLNGFNYEVIGLDSVPSASFKSSSKEILNSFGTEKSFISLSHGESFDFIEPLEKKYWQEVSYGFSDKTQRCRNVRDDRIQPHHLEKRFKKVKKDLYKFNGKLNLYDIPWELIEWSSRLTDSDFD